MNILVPWRYYLDNTCLYKNHHIQTYVEQVVKYSIESGAKHRLCAGAKGRGAKRRAPQVSDGKLVLDIDGVDEQRLYPGLMPQW